MQEEDKQVGALEEGGEVEVAEAEKGKGGAGEEDAELVEGGVGGVEGAVVREGGGGEGEEEEGVQGLVDGVFGGVDEEEGEHAKGGNRGLVRRRGREWWVSRRHGWRLGWVRTMGRRGRGHVLSC